MNTVRRYPAEVKERAVRLVFESEARHETQWAAIRPVAEKIGCSTEGLRRWVRQAERDEGRRPGLATEERARLKDLEREVRELRRFSGRRRRILPWRSSSAERSDGVLHRRSPSLGAVLDKRLTYAALAGAAMAKS